MTEDPQETAKRKEFVNKYEELCKKYGYKIEAYPKLLRDERGAWFTVIQYSVEVNEKN